ncbi:MAG: permease [Ectothiorhodospiraceae bacterium]|nr:permease [Ectothiorhodospiraceae bacterium]
MTALFLVIAAVSGVLLWVRHGGSEVLFATRDAGLLLLAVLPIVVMAVLMGAYVQKLIPPAVARRWVGAGSGLRGLALATVAGALTPGGPFAAFPLVVGLYHAGASLAVCVAYVTAWGVLGVQRVLVWEIAFFGMEFVLLRLLVSLPLPFLAGLLTRLLFDERGRA